MKNIKDKLNPFIHKTWTVIDTSQNQWICFGFYTNKDKTTKFRLTISHGLCFIIRKFILRALIIK
jgi:hypothetical protein